MKNGTYAEALEAGFNSKQAGFFARMCCDTKNEVYEHYRNERKNQFKEFCDKHIFNTANGCLLMFIIGIVIGHVTVA